jgi:peptide-methionine (R)-S-oxide reductase
MINRRILMGSALSALVASPAPARSARNYEVVKTEAEWRAQLTDREFTVLRMNGTERPFTSPLDKEYGAGSYHCKGCDLKVYTSDTKFDSKTGWPSFFASEPSAVREQEEGFRYLFSRTELSCRRCGGHLGHVFDDGPQPTGRRHCINGIALSFKSA